VAKSVIRAVPVAVLHPMIGVTEAVAKTLLGLRNSLDPVRKVEMSQKYKDVATPVNEPKKKMKKAARRSFGKNSTH